MLRPAAQRLKNKHVERALEQLDPTLIAFPFSHGSRYSTPTGSSLSTGWLKAGSVRVPKQIPRVTHTPGTHRAGSTFIDIRWTEWDRSSLTPTRHQCRLPIPLPLPLHHHIHHITNPQCYGLFCHESDTVSTHYHEAHVFPDVNNLPGHFDALKQAGLGIKQEQFRRG